MTIWMLYTAWALILASALIWRLIFGPRCLHDWQLVDKTEFKSAYELLHPGTSYWRDQMNDLLRRKVVIVMRCAKCGKCKIYETTSG